MSDGKGRHTTQETPRQKPHVHVDTVELLDVPVWKLPRARVQATLLVTRKVDVECIVEVHMCVRLETTGLALRGARLGESTTDIQRWFSAGRDSAERRKAQETLVITSQSQLGLLPIKKGPAGHVSQHVS